MLTRSLMTICLLAFLALSTQQLHAENWHQWRGPQANGHSQAKDIPVKWDGEGVLWKVAIPGVGQSSPVMWGSRLFVTSASTDGGQRHVYCLDRSNGKVLWSHQAWKGEAEPTHGMNNRASATCATDGKHLIAFFGRGGIHCYDLDGQLIWSRQLSPFAGPWGTAASPIIVGNTVIQNCDADESAFIVGLDKNSGEELWKTERRAIRGWSSPVSVKVGDRQEVILNGHGLVTSYNPGTGDIFWSSKTSSGRGTPTVTPHKGHLITLCGLSGNMMAVRPGGSGDVTDSHVIWRTPRTGGRDLPSPIVVDDCLLIARLRPGLVSCYDVTTGSEHWTERLEGGFSATPIVAGGLVYAVNEAGRTFVIRPGKKLEVVASNSLQASEEEVFRASPVPFDGHLLLRSDKHLYCVGTR